MDAPTKFYLEVAISPTAPPGTTTRELSRILRYWSANLHHYDLEHPTTEAIYDSSYNRVGTWTIKKPTKKP